MSLPGRAPGAAPGVAPRTALADRIQTDQTATFVPPVSVADAQARLDDVIQQYKGIDTQLAARRPMPGERLDDYPAYLGWRRRALAAKAHYEAEARLLKRWLKQAHIQQTIQRAALPRSTDPWRLLAEMRALVLDCIASTPWRPDETQEAVLDLVTLHLTSAHLIDAGTPAAPPAPATRQPV